MIVNTLTANNEYSCSNRENVALPNQIQLPEDLNFFSPFFIAFLESTLIIKHFENKELPR